MNITITRRNLFILVFILMLLFTATACNLSSLPMLRGEGRNRRTRYSVLAG